MAFEVEQISCELIAALRPLLPRIQRRDRALAVQLTRAASSIALNVSTERANDSRWLAFSIDDEGGVEGQRAKRGPLSSESRKVLAMS